MTRREAVDVAIQIAKGSRNELTRYLYIVSDQDRAIWNRACEDCAKACEIDVGDHIRNACHAGDAAVCRALKSEEK